MGKSGKFAEMPMIQLVAGQGNEEAVNEKNALIKNVVNKLDKTNSKSRLKILDQRNTSSLIKDNNPDTKDITKDLFKQALEGTGKDVEINSADNSYRMQNRSAEMKNIQRAVGAQLNETINKEIVKQAGIILKDNGKGEIKLVMKPESLGKVRIHLSLSDNNIAGRIIVDNNIVREIFESNLENLYKAFGSQGFENSGLEVSVQGKGGNSDGNNNKHGNRGTNNRNLQAVQESIAVVSDGEWANNTVNVII